MVGGSTINAAQPSLYYAICSSVDRGGTPRTQLSFTTLTTYLVLLIFTRAILSLELISRRYSSRTLRSCRDIAGHGCVQIYIATSLTGL